MPAPDESLKVKAPFVMLTVRIRDAELYRSTIVVLTPNVLGAIISECHANSSVGSGFPEIWASITLSQLPDFETPRVLQRYSV